MLTAGEFRDRLAALGLTQGGFARLTGVTDRTVRRWAAGDQDIPRWTCLLLDLLALPGARRLIERSL